VVWIQKSNSIVSVAGMIKVYNGAGEMYALNAARCVNDFLTTSIYKEKRS
jgi:hypothetical protein